VSKGGSTTTLYKTPTLSHYAHPSNSSAYREDLIFLDGKDETVKGNAALKAAIKEAKDQVAYLEHLYKTGEPPLTPEAKAEAESILKVVELQGKGKKAAAVLELARVLQNRP
jgi:hypothetical protein